MNPSDAPVARLARKLKDLRQGGLAGQKITQRQLGEALNASTPLISSWESADKPKIPPLARLETYATFFATDRSVTGRKFRLLRASELTPTERANRESLLHDLGALREGALNSNDSQPAPVNELAGSLWHFPVGQDVTIICAELPDERKQMSYANPDNPDYVRAYELSDLDALIALYGHIRAANPANDVNICSPRELVPQNFTAHLAVLGGIDWNPVTAQLLRKISLPVRQIERGRDSDTGGFAVADEQQVFRPEVWGEGASRRLEWDIGHFYRGPNPYNRERTVTICNGMFARGVLGTVTALTDIRMRARNEAYVRERFGAAPEFSILTQVMVANGEVVPPDWTSETVRLHEWHNLTA